MHEPLALVGEWLRKVVPGYYQYHAIPGNLDRLSRLWASVATALADHLAAPEPTWRSPWDRLRRLLDRWIPPPRVLHPYPEARFAASHPR